MANESTDRADEVLLQCTEDRIRVLTLNRPKARNALNSALFAALLEALVNADDDAEVGVVVLTGTDPAFCAGIDLKEAAERGHAFFDIIGDGSCITKTARMKKPIIGAINGATFTGGLEMALGCDFLIASERAVFADTHARVGIVPGGGMTARLPGAVGLRQARRMSMTGDSIDAYQAERFGLVVEVVPHDQLLDRTMSIARSITETVPETMLALKRLYAEGSATTMREALELEQSVSASISPDLSQLAARREAVMRRNRGQIADDRAGEP